MKTVVLLLFILISNQSFAQEQDSVLHRYGFVLDFSNEFINQIGFKYKASNDLSCFMRGMIKSSQSTLSSPITPDAVEKLDTYIANIGIEYVVARVNDLSLFVLVSGGVRVQNSKRPFYLNETYFTYDNKVQTYYSLFPGVGVEYYFSKQFSLSGYQVVAYEYSKENVTRDTPNPSYQPYSAKSTDFNLLNAKIAITFYF